VVEVSPDVEIQLSAVQSSAPRHLARLSQQNALTAQNSYDYVYDPSAGKGIDVYVFDSGIQRRNPAFENRVRFGMDFTGEGSGDDNGHGKN
jgi:subtilase-type proteinase RRT12